KLGIDCIVLNAHLMSRPEVNRDKLFSQLSDVVRALKADFGAVVDSDGERLILVDNKGNRVDDNNLLAMMVKLIAEENQGSAIAVPVNYPNVIDQIVADYNCKTIMTKAGNRALVETARTQECVLAGRNNGKFMFPQFHYG